MHIIFVDDSVKFDAFTPARKALGGAEKAFASLPGALARLGHEVTVLNNCLHPMMAEKAKWRPLKSRPPSSADILVAYRKPGLLGTLRRALKRVLWVTASPDYLAQSGAERLVESFAPTLMFIGETQARAYTGNATTVRLTPGIRTDYLETPKETEPFLDMSHDIPPPSAIESGPPPPHAIVTTHPRHGLEWLLDVWLQKIHPQLPSARLTVYSASLAQSEKEKGDSEDLQVILGRVREAASANVTVLKPKGDRSMAEIYRQARVHLYPGHERDFACWTLAESQATGLPAVARAKGAAGERIVNGQTGFIVPDADAFANVALEILTKDDVYTNLSEEAVASKRHLTWQHAAREFESHFMSVL